MDTMKQFLFVFCFPFVLGISIQSNVHEKCKTVNGPANNSSCIFPFRFREIIYNGCAQDDNVQADHNKVALNNTNNILSRELWCSTKINPTTRNHVGGQGNWGICSDKCPKACVDNYHWCKQFRNKCNLTTQSQISETNFNVSQVCSKTCKVCNSSSKMVVDTHCRDRWSAKICKHLQSKGHCTKQHCQWVRKCRFFFCPTWVRTCSTELFMEKFCAKTCGLCKRKQTHIGNHIFTSLSGTTGKIFEGLPDTKAESNVACSIRRGAVLIAVTILLMMANQTI